MCFSFQYQSETMMADGWRYFLFREWKTILRGCMAPTLVWFALAGIVWDSRLCFGLDSQLLNLILQHFECAQPLSLSMYLEKTMIDIVRVTMLHADCN